MRTRQLGPGMLLLGILSAGLPAQVRLTGRIRIPPPATTRLPGVLLAPAALPAAVYLLPERPTAALPGSQDSYLIRVVWNHFQPALRVVPAGAKVVFENQGTINVSLQLLRLRGQRLFEGHCAICHGANGEAMTPVGSSMRPHALNLTAPAIQARSESQLAQIVWHGIAGSGMPRWHRVLSYAELRRIVHYVKQLPQLDAGTELPPRGAAARRARGWRNESLGILRPNATLVRRFPSLGIYPVRIAGQNGERGYILVAPSAYCNVTDAQGYYRLPPAPPGRYQLVVWHPGSPAETRIIELHGDKQLSLNLH